MRHVTLLVAVLALVAFVGLGCGDDDDVTESTEKQQGSLSDPMFIAAKEAVEGMDGFNFLMYGTMLTLVDSVYEVSPNDNSPTPKSLVLSQYAQQDSVLLVYHSNSQYWYLYMGSIYDTTSFVIEDSVQFMHGTTPVQWPDSALLTGISSGARLTASTTGGSASLVAYHDYTLVGDIAGHGDVTLNGSRGIDGALDGTTSGTTTCAFDINLSSVVNNVVVDWDDLLFGCPSSGTATHTGSIALECTGDTTFSYSDSWTANFTYNGNSIAVVFENSTTRWTFTEECEYYSLTSKAARLINGWLIRQ